MVRFAAMLRDAWSEWRFEPERSIDAGDRVVVFMRVVAKGRESGVPIERTSTQVVTVRDGRMTSTRVYRDRQEALKAAGLEGSLYRYRDSNPIRPFGHVLFCSVYWASGEASEGVFCADWSMNGPWLGANARSISSASRGPGM